MICDKETTELFSSSSSSLKKTTLCSLTNMHHEACMSCPWVEEQLAFKCDIILPLWHCCGLSSDTDKFQASHLQQPLKQFQCVLCLVPLKAAAITQSRTVFQRQFLFCSSFFFKGSNKYMWGCGERGTDTTAGRIMKYSRYRNQHGGPSRKVKQNYIWPTWSTPI